MIRWLIRLGNAVAILIAVAAMGYGDDAPRCGQPNYDYHWGCLDKSGTMRPYCDKLVAPIHPQSYCYDSYKEMVSTWEQYQGKQAGCYVAPDETRTTALRDCGSLEQEKTR